MNIEYKAARILVSIAPFATAFIPAFLVFQHTQKYLEFPLWASIVSAIAAEAIGASAITMYYKAEQHNSYYTAEKNQIESRLAIYAYLIYLTAVLTTNALLEIPSSKTYGDVLAIFAKSFLSLLSLSGALLLSIHYQIGEVKSRYNKPKTTESTQKPKQPIQKVSEYNVKAWGELSEEMKGILKNESNIENLKGIFPAVTERTIYNWRKKVQEVG